MGRLSKTTIEIENALEKAETSVQSISINGETKEPDENGIVDLGNIEGDEVYISTLIYKATSKVENTRTPWNENTFGAPIIKHEFNTNTGVIYFRGRITTIGGRAFQSCTSLKSITIPDGVITIGTYAFQSCTRLTGVTIPDGVITIGTSAFQGCYSLTGVTIPDSVTTIGNSAFYGCSSLTSVYCKATTPPAGGSGIFSSNASGRKIYVPIESVNTYKSASYWSSYASDIVGYDFDVYFNDFYTKDETDNIIADATVTESTVSSWGFTKNTGTVTSVAGAYPSDGSISAIELYRKLLSNRVKTSASVPNILESGYVYVATSPVSTIPIVELSPNNRYPVEEWTVHFVTSSSGASFNFNLPYSKVYWASEKPTTLPANTYYELSIVKTDISSSSCYKVILTPFI